MITRQCSTGFVSVGKASVLLGISAPTLRNLLDSPECAIFCYRTQGQHRKVDLGGLRTYLKLDPPSNRPARRVMVAIRVSGRQQITSLDYQRTRCMKWCQAQFPDAEIILNERICSGLFLSHEKFIDIILSIVNKEITDLVVLHQDRLARGAVDMLKALMSKFSVTLHVLEAKPDKSYGESMAEDILAFIGSHHARYQGAKAKARLEVVVADEHKELLVKLYNEGYSLRQLVDYCDKHEIRGTKGQRMSHTKLFKIIRDTRAVLKEITEASTEHISSISTFIAEHIIEEKGGKVMRGDLDRRYAEWCHDNDMPILSNIKISQYIRREMNWTTKKDGMTGRIRYEGVAWKM